MRCRVYIWYNRFFSFRFFKRFFKIHYSGKTKIKKHQILGNFIPRIPCIVFCISHVRVYTPFCFTLSVFKSWKWYFPFCDIIIIIYFWIWNPFYIPCHIPILKTSTSVKQQHISLNSIMITTDYKSVTTVIESIKDHSYIIRVSSFEIPSERVNF